MKGGLVCEVICGVRTGQYAQVPHNKQRPEFEQLNKVYAQFFYDDLCSRPVLLKGLHVCGLISTSNIKQTGFYD